MSIQLTPGPLATRLCPACAAVLPADPGFVAWCEQCGWNLQPAAPPAATSLLGRPYLALGRRSGARLFERLAGAPSLRAGPSLSTVLAFLGAGLIHALTLALALGGAALLVSTWLTLGPALRGALMLALAWLLRPRRPSWSRRRWSAPRPPRPTACSTVWQTPSATRRSTPWCRSAGAWPRSTAPGSTRGRRAAAAQRSGRRSAICLVGRWSVP